MKLTFTTQPFTARDAWRLERITRAAERNTTDIRAVVCLLASRTQHDASLYWSMTTDEFLDAMIQLANHMQTMTTLHEAEERLKGAWKGIEDR